MNCGSSFGVTTANRNGPGSVAAFTAGGSRPNIVIKAAAPNICLIIMRGLTSVSRKVGKHSTSSTEYGIKYLGVVLQILQSSFCR